MFRTEARHCSGRFGRCSGVLGVLWKFGQRLRAAARCNAKIGIFWDCGQPLLAAARFQAKPSGLAAARLR